MSRILLFVRKTVRDCGRPKLLLGFLVPYLGLATLLAIGFASGVPDDFGSARLFTQEQVLVELYNQFAFVWLITFPMVFVAVLTATLVAGEAEKGTLVLLLSKPIERWEPLVGKFLGIVLYGTLTMVAGLFVGGTLLYWQTGASSAALSGSILSILPGAIVYACFVAIFVAAVGMMVAVYTQSQLKTALLTAIVPVLFFAFIFVRLLPVATVYEDYYLYLVDVNYHFGNAYVAIQGALGADFNPATQQSFDTVSGVYDTASAWQDPLLGGMPNAVPLAGYLAPVLSLALLAVIAVALLAGALFRFERMDIS